MAIVVVHGILNDGGVVEQFGRALADSLGLEIGKDIKFFEYPKRAFIGQWFGTHELDGRALAHTMDDGDDIICHSNGALLWQESIKSGAKWRRCFVFGGACTSDKMRYPKESIEEAHIIYNPRDWALFFGSLLPFHPFGKLGYAGYRGYVGDPHLKDQRFHNIGTFENESGINHSHYFTKDREKWIDFIAARI